MTEQMTDLAIVFVLGAVVGLGELVARYRDNPTRAIQTIPAGTYIGINGLASVLALVAIFTFGWTADASQTPEAQRMLRILAAGFGAMALFRTSLFVVRVGTTDIGVGPVAFLQILLAATDRGVDRKRASDRAEKVVRIMKDLDFDMAFNALPPFAIMLMQNLSLEDKTAIGEQAKAIGEAASAAPDETRILNLGLLLMNYVGEEVLEDAVRGVKGQSKPGGLFGRRGTGAVAMGSGGGGSATGGTGSAAAGGGPSGSGAGAGGPSGSGAGAGGAAGDGASGGGASGGGASGGGAGAASGGATGGTAGDAGGGSATGGGQPGGSGNGTSSGGTNGASPTTTLSGAGSTLREGLPSSEAGTTNGGSPAGASAAAAPSGGQGATGAGSGNGTTGAGSGNGTIAAGSSVATQPGTGATGGQATAVDAPAVGVTEAQAEGGTQPPPGSTAAGTPLPRPEDEDLPPA